MCGCHEYALSMTSVDFGVKSKVELWPKPVHKPAMKSTWLCILAFLLCSARLDARIAAGCTPEFLAHEAGLVFEGVPQHVDVAYLNNNRWLATVQFRVEKRIKGPLAVGDLVTVISKDWMERIDRTELEEASTKKQSVLVLAAVAQNTSRETDGRYVFLLSGNSRVFYPDRPVKRIYTESGAAIRSYAEVVKRAEAQVAKESQLMIGTSPLRAVRREIEIGWDTDAFKDLYSLSAVLVLTVEYTTQGASPGVMNIDQAVPDLSGAGFRGYRLFICVFGSPWFLSLGWACRRFSFRGARSSFAIALTVSICGLVLSFIIPATPSPVLSLFTVFVVASLLSLVCVRASSPALSPVAH